MLKITELSVESNSIRLLENINLEINEGEIHAILGPSCSGKTTFANAIAGAPDLEITSGKLNFKRRLLNKLSASERNRLGIFLSFQNPPEISNIKNLDITREILKFRQDKRNTVDVINDYKQLTKKFDLGSEWSDREFNLGASIGEKKKNELVQMRLMNPSLLILDEIDSGVTPEGVESIIKDLKEFLSLKGKACIIIAQDPAILQTITPTHVHIIVNGKIVKSGNKRIIKRIMQNGYREFS